MVSRKRMTGFVLDAGGDKNAVVQGPSENIMNITVCGKAAHAGVEPENGIRTVNLSTGTARHHTVEEIAYITGMEDMADLVVNILRSVE